VRIVANPHLPEIAAAQPELLARHCADGELAERAVIIGSGHRAGAEVRR